ncbi:MAG: metal-sensitive transcriptional regulator [Spirochaetia bacterium]|nr:metal-sensitive transcriptional regulator [Spirochaetia bacterium]MCF7946247.1 metal-sensitive transcriptional regulator [Spirochaetia bacterium]
MNEKQKDDAKKRLNKIDGQIRGIQKMIDNDRYCIDILSQTRAVVAAIRKVEDLIMHQHLNTCVISSMRSDNKEDQEEKIEEIMDVLSKFRRLG